MKLSTLGQIQPEQKQAAIIATALTKDAVKLGETSPVSVLAGILLGIGALVYVASSKD
jgi:hypothetical protein